MRVVILGANGLVGRAIVRTLRQRPDAEIVAGVRRLPSAQGEGRLEFRQIEAGDQASIIHAVRGATHAVNCIMGAPDIMIAATRNLCAAAVQLGNVRVVHFSSCAVYGRLSGLIDENAALGAGADWYGMAKI